MFLSDIHQPEVSLFFVLISLDATKFVLLRVFTLKETICPRICSKSRTKSVKTPLPVDVRGSKTSLLKLSNFSFQVLPMQLINPPKKEMLDKVTQPVMKLLTDRFCKQNKQIPHIMTIY